jgi:hypothetical protein
MSWETDEAQAGVQAAAGVASKTGIGTSSAAARARNSSPSSSVIVPSAPITWAAASSRRFLIGNEAVERLVEMRERAIGGGEQGEPRLDQLELRSASGAGRGGLGFVASADPGQGGEHDGNVVGHGLE